MRPFLVSLSPPFSLCLLLQDLFWQSGVVQGEGVTLGGELRGIIPTNVGGG